MTDVAAAPVAMKQRVALARPVGVVGRRSILNALFVLPYFVVFLVLMVVPLGVGIWLSFQDYDMLGGYGGPVGLANFTDLFNDKTFRQAVLNTFYFVLLSVPGFVVARPVSRAGAERHLPAQRGAALDLLRLVGAVGDHRHAHLAAGLHAGARHARPRPRTPSGCRRSAS